MSVEVKEKRQDWALEKEKIMREVQAYAPGRVKLAVVDIDGVLRGKVVHTKKFLSAVDERFGFCDVVFGWDSGDQGYTDVNYTGWHTGFPDTSARIDLSTFRKIPWENEQPFFIADFEEGDGNLLSIAPRSLLKKVRQEALSMGFAPIFSQEYEWFNFKEDPDTLRTKQFRGLKSLDEGMFGYSILRASQQSDYFNDLFDSLGKFGVPLEGLHTETGPGVYEAAILYEDVVTAADRAVLFKSGVKEIAYRHGITPTFMAKIHPSLPGCSGHVHQSLWDMGRETNLFYDEQAHEGMSARMRHYIAGILHALPALLPMYAPTVNSYKRLVEGHWAPTTLTWGIDNRTAAIRVLPTSEKGCRIELRVPGSDCNPYLAMSASLASGLYGIRNELPLKIPPASANAYQIKEYGVLPKTLQEATQAMKESELAYELLGEQFVRHFIETREWEWKQFLTAVTDWEFERYLEII